ncbi:MAG: MG2 domain-containing protein [Shimia sp.]
MRRILALLTLLASPLIAQTEPPIPSYIPGHIAAYQRGTDLPGGDLAQIFDTTRDACEAACVANARCTAFTFNERSNACFPKADPGAAIPFAGALSATIRRQPQAALDLATSRAGDLDFLRPADLAGARRMAAGLGAAHPAEGRPFQVLSDAAFAARGRPTEALRLNGAALSLSDRADLWVDQARFLGAAEGSRDATRRFRARAVSAAINGYLRAPSDPIRIAALQELATALERVGRGRDAIPALRLADGIAPRDDVAAALDRMIRLHGFRVADTQVDADTAEPRACAIFSEPLARGTDYVPFVQLPDPRLAVTVEDAQLCVTGLTHGERLSMTLRAGLPAASGETLWKPVPLALYVRDRSPSVRFPGRGYVLPTGTGATLPIETVNTDEVALTLRRMTDRNVLRAVQEGLFARQVASWEQDRLEGDLTVEVWRGTGATRDTLNEDVRTRLPMADALAGQPPGVYVLQAALPGVDAAPATQWFVLSDLGIATILGAEGLHVDIRALGTAAAREGVEVALVSRANEVLARATTDATGRATFAPGLTRGNGAAAPGLVTARAGDDVAILPMTGPAFDLSDRGVEGRAAPGPVDAFLATDRDAYRVGETIHATILVRDAAARAIEGLPVTAILRRPDGVEYARRVSTGGVAGGHVLSLPLGAAIPRGTWSLEVRTDPAAAPLARRRLLVEDFVPERIDVDLDLPQRPTDGAPLAVAARYLFGAPGADLNVEGDLRLAATRTLPGFEGVVFGRHDAPAAIERRPLAPARTDAQGRTTLALALPAAADARPRTLRATVRVVEGSARPIERSIERIVAPDGPVLGLRPLFDGAVPEGAEARFEALALDAALAPRSTPVRWELNRVRTRYQWYQLFGDWQWEPIVTRTRIATGEAVLDGPTAIAAPTEWGRYELSVAATDGSGAEASVAFRAGWAAPEAGGDTPDRLEVGLDRETYRPGDTATLRILARAPGTGVIRVMTDRIVETREVALTEGANAVPLDVTPDWGTGAYVSAALIRPLDVDAGRMPSRALGIAHASVDPGDRALDVALSLPPAPRPGTRVEVGLRVGGIAPGETAHLTLAAVDLGVLNITGFQSPDPQAHFLGQRALGVEMRDLYGRLIDGLDGEMGRIRHGGDARSEMTRRAPPPTEELATLFSGPIAVGPDGRATVPLDLPAFDGTLRLMAVAWSPSGVGQAEAEMQVRDPIVVTAALPRHLAPGDETRLLLDLAHADGPGGDVTLAIAATGLTLAPVPARVTLGEGGRVRVPIPLTAARPGDGRIDLTIATPGGERLTRTWRLRVQSNDPETAVTRRLSLAPGATFVLDDVLFAGLRPGTGRATVAVGPLARFDAPGLLAALDRYPYGCTEQVTSQALPLLYHGATARALGLATAPETEARIAAAIDTVLSRQAANGGFGLWRTGWGDLWLDAYVTDFLARARGAGHAVPQTGFDRALDNLRNAVAAAPDFEAGGEGLAYALLVLAREGAAATGDLRYYADAKGGAFSTPLGAAQLGAALAAYGDPRRADAMFARAARLMAPRMGDAATPGWRDDYGTNLRDAAAVLTLAAEAGSAVVDRAALAERVAQPRRHRSTQEQVWTLLAADALARPGVGPPVTLDGAPVDGPPVARHVGGAAQTFRNAGTAPTDLTVTTFGVPATAPPAGGQGYAIRRAHYTMEGAPLALDGIAVGTRFVTVLSVEPFEARAGRLMIDDPLPAGIEIDNPALLRSGDVAALPWLAPSATEMAEFRTDRFRAAIDQRGTGTLTVAYVARAVSPGTFHRPAALVEDMYRPRFRAVTDTGRVRIVE